MKVIGHIVMACLTPKAYMQCSASRTMPANQKHYWQLQRELHDSGHALTLRHYLNRISTHSLSMQHRLSQCAQIQRLHYTTHFEDDSNLHKPCCPWVNNQQQYSLINQPLATELLYPVRAPPAPTPSVDPLPPIEMSTGGLISEHFASAGINTQAQQQQSSKSGNSSSLGVSMNVQIALRAGKKYSQLHQLCVIQHQHCLVMHQ